VQFVAQPNPSGSPRVGTLTIAGLVYTVTEAGAPCAYSLDSTGVAVAAVGAVGSFNFAPLAAGCVPTALSYANWIATETNPGSVSFTVGPNPSASTRVGTIRIGEQNFTLTQTGGACGFSLNAYSALVGPVGDAARNVLGSPSALGCVPTVGTDQPGFISIGALFTPAANIFDLPYGVLPFASITPSVRFGNITFGGQIFLVKQTSY
jgi:hypothetical protein